MYTEQTRSQKLYSYFWWWQWNHLVHVYKYWCYVIVHVFILLLTNMEPPLVNRNTYKESPLKELLQPWHCSNKLIRTIFLFKMRTYTFGNLIAICEYFQFDVQCTLPARGGLFYKDHLPPLDIKTKKTKSGLSTGDKVYVNVTATKLKELAVGHGGWDPSMEEVYIFIFGLIKKYVHCSLLPPTL